MYQIKCDDYILYDPRDEDLIVLNPKCQLEVNAVGEGSFTILPNHPYYDKLKRLKSIFEIKQNNDVIFRGRMVNDGDDLYRQMDVDLEGVLGFTNDTIVPPFDFPVEFPEAASADNMVKYFLGWVLDRHNEHVEDWQKLKLGKVTVSDPNNYITRSSTEYLSTWDVLKTKLFESALGGYLVIRYEDDGNYIDYLSEFELTNTQRITLGENLLDMTTETDATETYTAILPFGAEIENADGTKYRLTIESLPDGNLTDDLVKRGKYIFSKSAVEQYGWICVPVSESKWDDVTNVTNLKNNAVEQLCGDMMLTSTITAKALDLHFTDAEIQSFRIYRNVIVDCPTHGLEDVIKPLTKLDIDILNPQSTVIVIGSTVRTLTDVNQQSQSATIARVESVEKDIASNRAEIVETKTQITASSTNVLNTCEEIIFSALKSYVETGDYESYKKTMELQMKIMADELLITKETTTESINNVNGDMQSEFAKLYEWVKISGGITLGSGADNITLGLDHNRISFTRKGVEFGSWDGVDFYTSNIIVAVGQRAQFGNFAFMPRSDESLMLLKVGG